jgi:uncharacterized protein with HEPN domain
MSERKPSVIIKDILHCIGHIQLYTANLTFTEFSNNFMVTEACLYNIQVMGEAVSKIPGDIKETENQIPWQLIKGIRNRLIHEYFGTDLQLVWNVIKNELPSSGMSSNELLIRSKCKTGNQLIFLNNPVSVFYRVSGTGSHGHVRNGAPAFRALYSCL